MDPSVTPAARAARTGANVVWFRTTPFGSHLSDESARQFLSLGVICDFSKGHQIFAQHVRPRSVYLLLGGRVSLVAERSDGEQAVLEVVGEGSVFPLAPLVLQQNSRMGAQAITSVKALVVPAVLLSMRMKEDAGLAVAVMAELARDCQQMVEQNKALKLQNTNQRLARFLLQHTHIDDGAVEVHLQDERRLLARRLGMTPESLSRAIHQLIDCGVEFCQQRVLIRDVDRLRQFCGLEIST